LVLLISSNASITWSFSFLLFSMFMKLWLNDFHHLQHVIS
jgi:hypothetical protein